VTIERQDLDSASGGEPPLSGGESAFDFDDFVCMLYIAACGEVYLFIQGRHGIIN